MQISSKIIKDGAVTEGKLGTGAVTADKIGTGAITEGKLGTGAVTEGKLGTGAVTANKIGSDAIDASKIADDAIDSEHITDGAIDAAHLSTDAKQGVLRDKYAAFLDQIEDVSAGSGTSVAITNKAFTAAHSKTVGGNSSVEGLITGTPNNKAHIRDASNGDEIQDSNGRLVYGRTTVSASSLTGTSAFTQDSTAVVGTDTLYTSELAANDWIKLDSSGKYYKVASITDDTHLTLSSNYGETSGSGASSKGTITLSYYVDISGSETAHTMAGQTIDVMIPESYDLYDAPYNGFISGVGFSEPFPADHSHDDRYFTETEIGATSGTTGGDLVGIDNTAIVGATGSKAQDVFEQIARKGRYEKKTIATEDVIPDLTYTPREAASVVLIVEGVPQRNGASYDYTVSSKTITWSYANSGFHISVGDEVWVMYDSQD